MKYEAVYPMPGPRPRASQCRLPWREELLQDIRRSSIIAPQEVWSCRCPGVVFAQQRVGLNHHSHKITCKSWLFDAFVRNESFDCKEGGPKWLLVPVPPSLLTGLSVLLIVKLRCCNMIRSYLYITFSYSISKQRDELTRDTLCKAWPHDLCR